MTGYADATDPIALLNRAPSTAGGPSVQEAVRGAGIEVRAVDWVWRKVVGESLVESVITPITGDFEKIARQAAEWGNVKDALQAIRNNMNSGLSELSHGWQGAAFDRFRQLIGTDWTLGLEADAQAAGLIGMALRKVADGSRRACDQALSLIKRLVDKLIQAAAMLPIPAVGWARAVKLVYDGIQLYNAIVQLIDGIKAIITGARQVIDGIRQVGGALAKLKDVRDLNDAINTGNQAAHGAASVKHGADSVRGGAQAVHAGATSAASAAASAHDNARGLIDERNSARQDSPNGTVPIAGNATNPSQSGGEPGTNRPADPNTTRTPECNRTTCGDPVDIVTGDVIIGQTDAELAGTLPLVIRRTHVSSHRAGRLFGRSWASTIDQRLELDSRGIVYIADDGVILVYPADGLPVAGPEWPLRRTDGGYTITRGNQVLHFAGTGATRPLAAITDAVDNRIDLHYDAGVLTRITHSGGYRIDVDTEADRVTALRLRDPAGEDITVARYRYSESGDLAQVLNSSHQALRFEYDTAGRVVRWIDRNDQWYRYLYDSTGACVANQGAGGFLNGTFGYDRATRTTRYTDALGATTTYRYDERGNVVAETNPLGHIVQSEWDSRDRIVARIDPLGNTTRNRYDDTGRLVAVTYPNGAEATVDYDQAGRPTRITDPDGAVWKRAYDDRGRIIAITDPAGAVTNTEYGPNQIAVTDPMGATTRLLTDPAGLPVAVTDPLGAVTQYARDPFGRVARIIDPLGGTVVLGWSIEGRLVSRTAPDGSVDRWRYDGEGNQVEHVDPMGAVSRTEITHFDLPAARTAPDGTRLEFGYDARLKLTSVTNAAGRVWRYEYDAAGNLVRETDFHGRTLGYEQDAAGRLTRRTNGAGEVVEFTRDALGNAVEKRAGGALSVFEFDPVGRLLRAANADADVRYTRDALGRVLSETCDGRTVTSAYDRAGRRVQRTTSSGAVSTWVYDPADRLVGLATAGRTVRFDYDVAGREVRRLFGDGAAVGQTWDANHRLTGQAVTTAAGRGWQRRYRYRGDGLVAGIDDTLGGDRRFDLDAAGRVTTVRAAGWTERYAYDRAGARVTLDGPRYRYDEQGRVVTKTKRTLSGQARSWHYTWDAEDRLVEVITPNGVRWRYGYDALGRRIAKQRMDDAGLVVEQIEFTWDGVVLAEQSTVEGVTTWETRPGDVRPITQTVDDRFYALVTDLVGTPTELLDEAGDIAWQSSTDLWGAPTAEAATGTDCPLRFPGQYHDAETGQHYNYMRYYDPDTGRYASRDPLGLLAGPDPAAYPTNPLVAADPLGLVPCTLTATGTNTYRSPGGLVYGPDPSPAFANRYDHVMNHANDIPNRPQHGVFNSANGNDVVRMVDDAYARVQRGGVVSIAQPNGNISHYVNMGQPVGYVGGVPGGQGGNPQVSYIQLVLRNGNEVVTAFPVSGIPSSVLGSTP